MPNDAARRSVRVVIADDSHALRFLLRRMLLKVCDVEIVVVGEALNGVEAVEQSERLKPQAVIMDVSMPLMNGIEATRAIRQRSGSVAIFGWTTSDDECIHTSMLAAGANGVFVKDGRLSGLVAAICELVGDEDDDPEPSRGAA